MVKEKLVIPDMRRIHLCIRSINHPIRSRILQYLHEEEIGTVTDIYLSLRVEQSVASQHLWWLRQVGVLVTAKEGKYIYYKIDYDRLSYITDVAHEFNETIQLLTKRTNRS